MDKKRENLIAVQKELAKQLKKQKETGKAKMPKNKEVIEPLKNLPGSKEVIESLDPEKLPGSKESIKKNAMGGKIQTEYRGGGMVNLGNYKGQF